MTTTIHIINDEYQLDISTCLGFRDTLYISTKYGKFFTTIQMRLEQSPVAARRDYNNRELFTDRPRVSLSDLAKRFADTALYSYRRMNTACRDRRFHRARSRMDKVFISAYAIAALEREGLPMPCRHSLRLSDSGRLRWPRSTIAVESKPPPPPS